MTQFDYREAAETDTRHAKRLLVYYLQVINRRAGGPTISGDSVTEIGAIVDHIIDASVAATIERLIAEGAIVRIS